MLWEEDVVVSGFLLSEPGNIGSCAWAVFLRLQRVSVCAQDVVSRGLVATCLRLCREG